MDKIRVSYQTILDVFESKDSTNKVFNALRTQSRQNIIVLRTIAETFEEFGEEKMLTLAKVYNNVVMVCR